MIEIREVVNYESVSKMLNLLYSQNPHSFSPLFHPNLASGPPKITPFHFKITPNSVSISHPSPHYLLSLPIKWQVLVYPFLSMGLGVAGGWWVAYGESEQADGVLLEGDFVQQLLG